jgi:hypothetical protein
MMVPVSFPKIISGHIDDVARPERVWRRCCRRVGQLAAMVHPFVSSGADVRDCNMPHKRPSPKRPEARTMPAQDGIGLNHFDCTKQAWPEPSQPNHQHSITAAQSKPRRRPPQCDIQLMTEKQVLGFKPAARLEQVDQKHSKQVQDRKHRAQRCNDSAL